MTPDSPAELYPAASLADYFRAWLTRHPDRRRGTAPLRGLETAHFEFRGGAEDPPVVNPRRRAEDRGEDEQA